METFSALLDICAGNSPVSGEFPAQRPVTRGFDVFFDLGLNKRLSKQSQGWWFETLSCPIWRQVFVEPTILFRRILTNKKYGLCFIWSVCYDIIIFRNAISPNLAPSKTTLYDITISTYSLTHWGRDKMAAIFQTTFWNGFSLLVKMYTFQLRFHWSCSQGCN